MSTPERLVRTAIAPAAGIGFVAFWTFEQIGRIPGGDSAAALLAFLPLLLLGAAIGASASLPYLSISAVLVLVGTQLLVPGARLDQNSYAAYAGLLFVAGVLGSNAERRVRVVALGVVAISGACIGLLLTVPALGATSDQAALGSLGWGAESWVNVSVWSALFAVASAAVWLVGFAFRARYLRKRDHERRLALEAELEKAEVELDFVSERDRIAQDVHDIMAHSLSVIVAQADGARFLGEMRNESTTGPLTAIAQSARESLIEVRMLIDSLDPEPVGHSYPTLDELDSMYERMRSAGLFVECRANGDAGSLTSGQQMAVYRIVQESLTNALKHGGRGARADVVEDWHDAGLTLTVTSHGLSATPAEDSPRRGLRGMRERARLAGGWLQAGPDEADEKKWVVTAFIPQARWEQPGATAGGAEL